MRRVLVIVCALFVVAHPVAAEEIDKKAVDKAHAFLKDSKCGEFVNGFVHFGTKYLGHKYVKTLTVKDERGRQVPGHFALVYDYDWSDRGQTQLAFLCDTRGGVYKVQVLASNGIFQTPFAVANLSIKIVGEALYDALKDQLNDTDKRLLRQLVDDANAQGLLHLGLRIRQANE